MIKHLFDAGWEVSEASGWLAMGFAQWRPVTLPHDISITKPRSADHRTGSGGGYAWSGAVTYRKRFPVPEEWQGKVVQLEFEGVYMNAEVSINGNLVVFHPYGYTSFLADLTPFLIYGEENEVTVVANNSAQPNSRWYSGTGIYRHVWLRLGDAVRIEPWGVFVRTPVVAPDASEVLVTTEIANGARSAARVTLRSTVKNESGAAVAQVESMVEIEPHTKLDVGQKLTVSPAELWSVRTPYLYTMTSELVAEGEILDAEETTFGIRSIAVDAENGFRLNGVPMKLKGGCVHHDNGLLGAASYDRAEERKIELMKSAGFNAIRCAHNPPAPAMLEACDRLGMLVIDETFDCWRMGKSHNDYHLFFEDWWQRDTEAMVRRDRNHPSIVMWSIGNEVSERTGVSEGYAWSRRQVECVRALDDTRFITSAVPALFEELMPSFASGDMEQAFEALNSSPSDPENDAWGTRTAPFLAPLDVAGYNYLSNRYEVDGETFPDRVMCGTETFPHRAFAFWDVTSKLPYVIGDFVWTSIDYLGEAGIGKVHVDEPVSFAAEYPYHLANCGDFDICGFKRPQSYYRDVLWGVRQEPFIAVLDPALYDKEIRFTPWGWEPVIDSWTFPGLEGKPTTVDVYSADEEVELIINGASVGRKPVGAARQNKATFEVTYEPGTIVAVGYAEGRETGRHDLVTAGAPTALRLVPDRATLAPEFGDLAYVTTEIVDEDGVVVRYADHEVTFEVTGPGDLIAVGAPNPVSEELYVGDRHKAYEGRLMAVVRTSGEAGEIVLKATADGLAAAEVTLQVPGA